MRIEPAALAFDANGTPCSPAYGDVYHSADSGPGQARHVFLAGNDLPSRWRGARVFTVLETGFGLGLNFLATWSAWRDDPAACERLHFVSVEKHPFTREALVVLHEGYPEFRALSAALLEKWPPLVPGLHRLHFAQGRVSLTLALGDIAALLPKLRLAADAIYLDGFSPGRNPEMWAPPVAKALARLSHRGTTLATWSTAGSVRHALEAAGYALEKRAGFGRKREMLAGRYAPRWPIPDRASRDVGAHARRAVVVGGGIAGAAVSQRLVHRGWVVDVIDDAPARTQNDAFVGVFHPHVSRDDCSLSRAVRSGFLYARAHWDALERAGCDLAWDTPGVLQLVHAAEHAQWPPETVKALGYPDDYARYVTRESAESLAGAGVPTGGWWFPSGGWIRPGSVLAAQRAGAQIHAARVEAIERRGENWCAIGNLGAVIAAAPVLVLANAEDAARLTPFAQPLKRVRGQITVVPARDVVAPRGVITGAGYVLPAIDEAVVVGSSYDGDDDPMPRTRDHEANLLRLAHMLPGSLRAPVAPEKLAGAVGFRAVAPDRLPLVGAVPDVEDARAREDALAGAHLGDLPRRSGLYCVTALASRGLAWAALAGELVASTLEGEPLPVEGDLVDALDPARFVLRGLRARQRARSR